MNFVHASVALPEKLLHVFNTHGIWGFDGFDNKRRLAMSQKIIGKIEGKKPLILAGDFNILPTTSTIKNIENHLTSVFKNALPTTFCF